MIDVVEGSLPIVLGLPHTGTEMPEDMRAGLNDRGRLLADTDWHVDRLYDGLGLDVSSVRTPVHRYVIDVNRDPQGHSLYPGQNGTDLCPLTDFDGAPIWRDGAVPDGDEIARRVAEYHAPYHAALAAELARVRARHGVALLYDCHSIRSRLPHLFAGELPELNIGTDGGRSCAPMIERAVHLRCRGAQHFTCVLNGRFKGGWSTRTHGRPETGIHALQMEVAQRTYMVESPPWTFRSDKAERLRSVLYRILNDLAELLRARDLS